MIVSAGVQLTLYPSSVTGFEATTFKSQWRIATNLCAGWNFCFLNLKWSVYLFRGWLSDFTLLLLFLGSFPHVFTFTSAAWIAVRALPIHKYWFAACTIVLLSQTWRLGRRFSLRTFWSLTQLCVWFPVPCFVAKCYGIGWFLRFLLWGLCSHFRVLRFYVSKKGSPPPCLKF